MRECIVSNGTIFSMRGMFVIDENFKIIITQQIQVYFVAIITNGHYKRTFLIQSCDLFLQ